MSIVTNGFFNLTSIQNDTYIEINKNNSAGLNGWIYADINGVNNVQYGFTYGNHPMAVNGFSPYGSNLPDARQCFAMQQVLNPNSSIPSIATIKQTISLIPGSYNLSFRLLYRDILNSGNQSCSVDISNASSTLLTGVNLSGLRSGTSKIYTADNSGNWTDSLKNGTSYKSYDFAVSNSGTYNLIFTFTLTYSDILDSTIFLTDVIINSKVLPKPWGAYIAGHSKNSSSQLYDITGQGRHANITGTTVNYANSGNGASASIPYIGGYAGTLNNTPAGSGTQIRWPAGSIPSNFTICSITRYSGANKQRILSSSDSSFVYGHWGGWGFTTIGTCIYNNAFITLSKIMTATDWCVMCATINPSVPKPNNILVNNTDVGEANFVSTTQSTLTINDTTFIRNECSDFAFQQIIIWDTPFNIEQLSNISSLQNNFLTTGIMHFPFKEVIYNPPKITSIENYELYGYKVYFDAGIITGTTDPSFTYLYFLGDVSYNSGQNSSPVIIRNLQNQSYNVSLAVMSVAGISSSSNVVLKSVPYIQGGAPPNISVVPGLNSLTYSYTASYGGNVPTVKYYYSDSSNTQLGNLGTGTTGTSFTITDLSQNRVYQYYLIAIGLSGTTEIWRTSVFSPAMPYIQGSAPSNISVVPGFNSLTYSYTASSGGNAPTIKYYYSTNRNAPLSTLGTGTTGTSFTVPNLLLNQSYQFYIIAIGISGTTEIWRNSVLSPGTPYIQGSVPSNISVTPGLNSLTYSYTASFGGNPSVVKYYYSTNSNASFTTLGTGTTGTSFTISNLLLNQSYQFYIIAIGLSGTTEVWRNSVLSPGTPYVQGGDLSNISVTPGLNSLTYSYAASSGNAETIKYYHSYSSNTSLSALGTGTTGTSLTVVDLSQNRAYPFYIIAIGLSGETELWRKSVLSPGTPYIQGSAPLNISISPGLNSLTYSYTASSGGNAPTIKYYYSRTSGSAPLSLLGTGTTGTSLTVTDLSLNKPYRFYIIAIGLSGTTEIWRNFVLSSPETPYIPGYILSVTPGLNKLTYSYTAYSGGNAPVIKYYYSINSGSTPLLSLGIGTTATSLTVTDLSLNMSYQIYIIAIGLSSTTELWRNSILSPGTPYIQGSAPSNIVVTPAMNSITYSYSASSGGNPSFVKYYYSIDKDASLNSLGTGTTGTSITISDLSLNQPYPFYIIAIGLSGSTEIWRNSTLSPATPYVKGGPPLNISIVQGLYSLTYSYLESPGAYAPTIKYYYSTNSNTPLSSLGTGTTKTFLTISDLSLNKSYDFYIIVVGLSGTTELWRNSAFTSAIPFIIGNPYVRGGPPLNISVARGLNSLLYSYDQSLDGNAPIIKYYYSTDSNTRLSLLGTGTTNTYFTVTDLSLNKPYQFYIIVIGLSGTTELWRSFALSPSETPHITGSAPSNISVTPDFYKLTYSYTASFGGNASVVKYYYSTSRDTPLNMLGPGTTETSITISDLSVNRLYQFYIIAIGLSETTEIWRESAVASGTPYIIGSAPSNISVTSKLNTLIYSFTESFGGNPSTVRYYYSTNKDTPLSMLGPGTTQNTITVSNLFYKQPYQFYIIAIGLSGSTEIWRNSTLSSAEVPFVINMYNAKDTDLQKYCETANCKKQISYNQLKTASNDPSISKRMRYAQYVKNSR
jgi:hypothetical protein